MTDESSARRKWLSLYVGFQATTIYGVEADRVIVRIVAPLVDRCFERRWIRRFFYIRYSELMPHIRLRLLPIEAELADEVRREVEREITSRSPNAVVGRLAVPEPGTPVLADDERVANLAWVDYEPEVDRYGGLQALRVAERFFEDSSKASIAMLRSLSDSRSSRLGQSLLQMLIVSHSFARKAQAAAALSDFFSRSYLPALAKRFGGEESTWEEAFSHGFTKQASTLTEYVCDAWERLETGSSLGPAFDALVEATQQRATELERLVSTGRVIVHGRRCTTWQDAQFALAPSYLHMLCNRNGTTMAEEAYLANLMNRALLTSVP